MSKFEVGDIVWCLFYGKGIVVRVSSNMREYPVSVDFPNIDVTNIEYTSDGKFYSVGNRVLFFSEPKVEALTDKPFKSALIGQRIMVMLTTGETRAGTVMTEDEISISISRIDSNIVFTYYKKELIAIYKLSDNLF